jgi:hypothetical protein
MGPGARYGVAYSEGTEPCVAAVQPIRQLWPEKGYRQGKFSQSALTKDAASSPDECWCPQSSRSGLQGKGSEDPQCRVQLQRGGTGADRGSRTGCSCWPCVVELCMPWGSAGGLCALCHC